MTLESSDTQPERAENGRNAVAPLIGVAADDLTGATDIGAFFSKAGLPTYVFPSTDAARAALPNLADARAVIIDTASRYDDPDIAYRKVFVAMRFLREAGVTRFFKKTCSVFRGNVGREMDAMLDALGQEFAVVVSGYPRNRRTMEHGIEYVEGKPLAESHFARDPYQPTTRSNLVEVLQGETRRAVCLVDLTLIARGPAAVQARIEESRATCSYLMLDVPDDAALRTIACASVHERVFAGAAGLAGELAPLWNPDGRPCGLDPMPCNPDLGVPVVSGSLTPVTTRQVEALRRAGAEIVSINAACLFHSSQRDAELERVAKAAAFAVQAGRNAVVTSPNDTASLAASRDAAGAAGLEGLATARHISHALGEIAARIVNSTGQNRLLLCGGETAAAACSHLGVGGFRIGPSLEPGIPICETVGAPRLRLVLKGGSMGSTDILLRAIESTVG